LTTRAASKDSEFRGLVAKADQARDSRQWVEGENHYREALALYPAHSGYMVQYAHCLKEQQKFPEAEIYYRSALALGAPARDVEEHVDFVASQQGYHAPVQILLPANTESGTMMDAPPTKDDIDLVSSLLIGWRTDTAEVLHLLRTRRSVREVFAWVIAEPRFQNHNRELMSLIADGALPL